MELITPRDWSSDVCSSDLVHQKKLVDATVLNWLGAFNAEEGAKHLVRSHLPRIISHDLH
jgi:hypothetical protein